MRSVLLWGPQLDYLSPTTAPSCWVPLCLPDTTTSTGHHYYWLMPPTSPGTLPLPNTVTAGQHHYCHHPQGLNCAVLPVAEDPEMPKYLCVLWSHPYTKSCYTLHYTESRGYESRAAYALVFQEIWFNSLFPLNLVSPSFQSTLESIEDWLRVKSKGNQRFRHSTCYIFLAAHFICLAFCSLRMSLSQEVLSSS